MSVEQPSTQSTPSRASSMVRDSVEETQLVAAAPTSVVQGVHPTSPRATPTQENKEKHAPNANNPMQQVITIFYGDKLRSWTSIHERTLCKYSEKMTDIALKAAETREAHTKVDGWLEQIESITVLGEDLDLFEKEKLGAKLIPLVLKTWEQFPVPNYQNPISKAISDTLDKQFSSGNLIRSAEKPKTLKEFKTVSSNKRLHLLNAEGLVEVAEEVCTRLQKFKAAEKQRAKTSALNAWAQGRLLLRGASEQSVVSLVEWAYHGTLNCDNAENLYDFWALATRLRFDVLAEECMNRLYNSASASLSNACSNGVSLRSLLGLSNKQDATEATAQSSDVVVAVFHHVLRDEKTPEKLTELIVDALARGMDMELWIQVQDLINPDIKNRLINFMIVYRDIKVEGGLEYGGPVKLEPPAAPQEQYALTD